MGNVSDLYNRMNSTSSLKPNNTKKGLDDIIRKSIPENEIKTERPVHIQVDLDREPTSGSPNEADLISKTLEDRPKKEDLFGKTNTDPAPQLVTADKDNLSLYLKLAKNVSSNCLKMYCLIDELCKHNNEWKKITREEFILAGIKGEKITSSRLEGKERGLFDFREIEHKNEKTGKTNITHVLYRLIK